MNHRKNRSQITQTVTSLAVIIAGGIILSGCFSKEPDAVRRGQNTLEEKFHGTTTIALPEEAVSRVLAALPGTTRSNGTFTNAVNVAAPNLALNRDPAQMGASSALAVLKLAHGGCDSVPNNTLTSEFGLTLNRGTEANADALKEAGIRVLENATGILVSDGPELYAKAEMVFEDQIKDLIAANATIKQAWDSVCASAIAASFSIGI